MLDIGHRPLTGLTADGLLLTLLCALPWTVGAAPVAGQTPATEEVTYTNERDGTFLTATLVLPAGDGPHPGVVVLTVAGTRPLVDRMVGDGYAVLMPVRRGFVDVEPLLQATYADLAGDARAAIDYLGSRPDVDRSALAMIAQADDTQPALISMVASDEPVPLVLMAPPAFPGTEAFRLEQRGVARRFGVGPAGLAALDEYVGRIADVVLGESAPYVREYRLESLRAVSSVQLPYNAAFPDDERQMHFFASPLWHDRLAFVPEIVLARLRSPALVLIGTEDPDTPVDAYLETVTRGLSAGGGGDGAVCLLEGRTRHSFTPEGVSAIAEWLAERVGTDRPPGASVPSGCLEPDGR